MRYFLTVAFLILLFSCGNKDSKMEEKPGDVLEKDTFIVVMIDFRLAEAAIRQMIIKGEDSRKATKYYYDFMLKKHKIRMKDFEASLRYYSKDPEEMDEIYTKVVAKLSELQSKPKEE